MHSLYRALLSVRPVPLAVLFKRALRIKRRVVTTTDGKQFWIDPVSHFGWEVLDTGIYEPVLTELLRTLLRPGDTFVDVGANEGYFSVIASALVKGEGRVLSIEPQSRLLPVIRENATLNQCRNLTLFHTAVSDSEMEIELHLPMDTNTGGASIYKRPRFGVGVEKIRAVTFDAFFKANNLDRVRLIKIDCEGAELSIVNGARSILAERRADFISVDYHPTITGAEGPEKIDKVLRDSGYLLTQAGTGIWTYHLPGLEKELRSLGASKNVIPLDERRRMGIVD